MAYYNPYYEFAKTGSDFAAESGANMNVGRRINPNEIQSSYDNGIFSQGKKGGNNLAGTIINGVAQLGSAMTQESANPYDFSIDPYAGLTGSAQGLMGGGVAGAIIGGITNQIGTFGKVNRNLKNLDTSVNLTDVDPVTGKPMYQGSAAANANNIQRELQAGDRKLRRSVDPGTQIMGAVFGTKRKIRRKQQEVARNLKASRDQYNQQTTDFNSQELAMGQYNQLMNNQNRLRNLYSIGTNLY